MKNFVIVYDTEKAELIKLEAFTSADDALKSRFEMELKYPIGSLVEVVVLRAKSRKAIRESHPRYFAEKRTRRDRISSIFGKSG